MFLHSSALLTFCTPGVINGVLIGISYQWIHNKDEPPFEYNISRPFMFLWELCHNPEMMNGSWTDYLIPPLWSQRNKPLRGIEPECVQGDRWKPSRYLYLMFYKSRALIFYNLLFTNSILLENQRWHKLRAWISFFFTVMNLSSYLLSDVQSRYLLYDDIGTTWKATRFIHTNVLPAYYRKLKCTFADAQFNTIWYNRIQRYTQSSIFA